MRPLVAGDSSDGLSTKQFPAAMAPIWARHERPECKHTEDVVAHHGTECQPDWIVERADGENDTLGFFSDDGAKCCKIEVERRLFCARPLVDAVIGDFAVADGRVEFEAAARDDGDRQ
jgi:hypothetical protein